MKRLLRTWKKPTERNKLYGAGAHAYERHAETSIYNARYERPAMLAAVGDVTGLRILDAGCAAGFYAATLGANAAEILAVDASEEMIALVEAKQLANVQARVHDLSQALDWIESSSLDLVMSSLTMHYLESWEGALAEFYRVLRPGGRILVSTHHPAMTGPAVENYFDTQRVTETWVIGGIDTRVSFYHRPMNAIVNPFAQAGFAFVRMIEPHLQHRADATEAERRLELRPWFLIVECEKSN